MDGINLLEKYVNKVSCFVAVVVLLRSNQYITNMQV